MVFDTLPANRIQSGDGGMPHALWLRINAFLDLKTANTQRTYVGIINEWCQFLGCPAGSSEAAERFIAATDLHAIAYKKWLNGKPGQRPRFQSEASESRAVSTEQAAFQSHDGLQSTQANATIVKKFAALRRKTWTAEKG